MTEHEQAAATSAVDALTLEQKAALTSGIDFWNTATAPGVPSILVTDGPHGVRKARSAEVAGIGESVPATCFPPAAGLASTFDPGLVERVGAAIGREAQAEGVAVVLGPGVNIKRSPLGGRNFEYFSEDPYLTGVLGGALVRGIQSQGVGASLKHFAANNQETDRMRVSADVDERPLREIYLAAFRRIVTEAQPWTVMCSYNRVNGVLASQDPWLLTSVLREEWGFDGLVVSDWGAVADRVAALAAGLDLEMPSSGGVGPASVVRAVGDGRLDERLVDRAASRVARLALRSRASAVPDAPADHDAHHALAREAAARAVVLLKNERALLPLSRDRRVAVIGEFARTPRYQGAGSSLINPTRLDDALTALRELAGDRIAFAPGFTLDDDAASVEESELLAAEAVAAAADAEVALLFLGLPPSAESEGFDRAHLDLPARQLEVLERVLEVNPHAVVVLQGGGVVQVSGFVDRVPALVEAWLGGQAGGGAIAEVLYGRVNPSGRLAETFPLRIEDTPAFGGFPGEHGHVRYAEGLFVGYRWYDARGAAVSFPFGHGLSYTEFSYRDFAVTVDEDGLGARVTITNVGRRAGREVAQLYVGLPGSTIARAPRELRAFAGVDLEAGAEATIELRVPREDLGYWDTRVGRFVVEGGDYEVSIGASSRDLRITTIATIAGDAVTLPLTADSSIGELLADPAAAPLIAQLAGGSGDLAALDPELLMMMQSFPIGRLASFPGATVSSEQLEQLLAAANAQRG